MTQRWYRARSAEAVGSAIQAMRSSRGLSQDVLAEQTRSSRATISRLERGRDVSLSQVMAAAAAMNYEIVFVPRGARVSVDTDQP